MSSTQTQTSTTRRPPKSQQPTTQTRPKAKQSSAQQQAPPDPQSDAERRQETSKAAQRSLQAQREAQRLTQAAAAAGDPNERQKLLNAALEKEVEAETFGKTAKYLQTGAFQGLCAGAGLGTGIGVSLGVVTGSLVGGVTSLVTGSLGAGLGLGIGAAHGPWFSVGEAMGNGIRKITGDLPGWKATEEQKRALEDMIKGVRAQDRPGEEDLVRLSQDGGGKVQPGKGYTGQREEDEKVTGSLKSLGKPTELLNPTNLLWGKEKKNEASEKSKVQGAVVENTQPAEQIQKPPNNMAGAAITPAAEQKLQQPRPQARPGTGPKQASSVSQSQATAKSPKSQYESEPVADESVVQQPSRSKKPPRKLEIRSRPPG